jgi:glycosyltransferase involved in cell wall biosynthesis
MRPSLRVMLLSASFAPVVGGAESYAMELARGLAARGHELLVATDVPRGYEPSDLPPVEDIGFEVRRLSGYLALLEDPSKIRWEQMAYALMDELADCAERLRPDVVVTNSLDTALLGKTIALALDVPWAAAFHEHSPEDEALARGRLRLVYDVLRPELVLAGSRFYEARARCWGPQTAVELIYHGVDADRFHPGVDGHPARARYGFGAGELVIVCAGRLKPRKGIGDLLHAFRHVRECEPRARLLIAGSVSSASLRYAHDLERDIDRFGLRDVVTIDRGVTYDRMPEILAASDLVAQPSWEEGLGLSVLEAMSAGRATVTTDVAGIREIVAGADVALVVPPGEPPRLAQALLALLAAPAERARLGARARAHVERSFSRTRMLDETERTLLALARRARRGAVDLHV